ncbi:MAG: hypothetical protein WBQ23_02375 [Bacteroidota bacterium]
MKQRNQSYKAEYCAANCIVTNLATGEASISQAVSTRSGDGEKLTNRVVIRMEMDAKTMETKAMRMTIDAESKFGHDVSLPENGPCLFNCLPMQWFAHHVFDQLHIRI